MTDHFAQPTLEEIQKYIDTGKRGRNGKIFHKWFTRENREAMINSLIEEFEILFVSNRWKKQITETVANTLGPYFSTQLEGCLAFNFPLQSGEEEEYSLFFEFRDKLVLKHREKLETKLGEINCELVRPDDPQFRSRVVFWFSPCPDEISKLKK